MSNLLRNDKNIVENFFYLYEFDRIKRLKPGILFHISHWNKFTE